ncbi:acyl-CoA dehydrogenase family protein [Kordiimonas lacus]|uniref:Acyl-CoA dehydrogenase n=1 Tax=Kordiimonas lacus TaxID=637679 RepID=A0A1G6YBW1_9PROT|nr:acyl-CoA dehydrogenase family protein [Kordiimonas lacus]SDD87869.1 Acyl-CoA dehydrogenase [Kordiimonas lacus]
MDFNLSDDHRMLKDMVSRFVREQCDFESRLKLISSEKGHDEAVWAQMAELGLVAAVLPERVGGLGGSGLDIMVVAEELGRKIVVEPFLATAVLGAGLLAEEGAEGRGPALLDDVIGGGHKLALAHYEPGARYNAAKVDATIAGGKLSGSKSLVINGGDADTLVVSAKDGDKLVLALVAKDAEGVAIKAFKTHDGFGAAEVTFTDVAVAADDVLLSGDAAEAALGRALARATLALCAESLGAMENARDATLEYLRTRTQFGVPIGKFQVLQHRLVDVCLEIEQVRSIVLLAASKLDAGDRDKHLSAAKALVGRVGRMVAEEAVQMHGGIGVTWELELAHVAKRLVMIDHYFGDTDYHLKRFQKLSKAA